MPFYRTSGEMGCEEAFISERRKHQKHTEFACFIRNHKPEPSALAVPLGLMEREPRLSDKERKAMLAANRLRICGDRRDVRSLGGPRAGEEAERAAVSQQEML